MLEIQVYLLYLGSIISMKIQTEIRFDKLVMGFDNVDWQVNFKLTASLKIIHHVFDLFED